MVSNRQSREEHESDDRRNKIPIQESKQKHNAPKQATLSGVGNTIIQRLWTNDLELTLHVERFMRGVVREEVERKIQDHLYPSAKTNQSGISRTTPFQLRFINKLPDTIFTNSNMIAEDKTPIQIALFDVRSQSVVNVSPLSSLKIEICALNGEFGLNGSEDWTEGEFKDNILRQRDGKRPLLNGDRFVTLKNGVGCIHKLMLTDNSRWIRCRKFRLGAKVVQSTSSEAKILEGRSEPFVVKDYRGESYKKHYPPSLNDDVWRLKQIAKDRKIHKRLSQHGIHTVKDLLRLYTTNPSSLYEKVGIGNISKRSWQAIIEHAETCVIDDDKFYVYQHTAEIGLLFNSIYVLVGVTFNGQNYCSLDTLTPNDKHLVETVKQHAYKNVNNLKSIDEISLSYLRPLASLGAGQSDATDHGLQQFNNSTVQEGYGQPSTSTTYTDKGVHNYQVYADPHPDIREMPLNSSLEGGFISELHILEDNWPPNGSNFPNAQGGCSIENDCSYFQFTNCCSPCTTWGIENGFCFDSSDGADFCLSDFINSTVSASSSGKAKAKWYKIWNALKCVISIRRDAAATRRTWIPCWRKSRSCVQ